MSGTQHQHLVDSYLEACAGFLYDLDSTSEQLLLAEIQSMITARLEAGREDPNDVLRAPEQSVRMRRVAFGFSELPPGAKPRNDAAPRIDRALGNSSFGVGWLAIASLVVAVFLSGATILHVLPNQTGPNLLPSNVERFAEESQRFAPTTSPTTIAVPLGNNGQVNFVDPTTGEVLFSASPDLAPQLAESIVDSPWPDTYLIVEFGEYQHSVDRAEIVPFVRAAFS